MGAVEPPRDAFTVMTIENAGLQGTVLAPLADVSAHCRASSIGASLCGPGLAPLKFTMRSSSAASRIIFSSMVQVVQVVVVVMVHVVVTRVMKGGGSARRCGRW
jgi:hypothetical protein